MEHSELGPLAVSVERAAALIGVSRPWMYGPNGPLTTGELPIVRLGRRVVIRTSDLMDYLASRVSQSKTLAAAEPETGLSADVQA